MPKRGISLKLDDSGGVTTVAPEEGEPCCGIKICSKCINNICHAIDPPQSSLSLKKCPLKKWYILWTAPDHGEKYSFGRYPTNACQCCGGKEFWQAESIPTKNGRKKGDPVCILCHPPPPNLKILLT